MKIWFNSQPPGSSRVPQGSSQLRQALQFKSLSYFRMKCKGNAMLPTPHFWNNFDLNTFMNYLTEVLSTAGEVRRWFGAGESQCSIPGCPSALRGQEGSVRGACETELAVRTADSSDSAAKKSASTRWKALLAVCSSSLLPPQRVWDLKATVLWLHPRVTWKSTCIAAIHSARTILSVWFSKGVPSTSVWKIQTIYYWLQMIYMLKLKARKVSCFSQ